VYSMSPHLPQLQQSAGATTLCLVSLSLPYELKELGAILLPLLHPLLHGYDDCVGLVVRPMLRAFLSRSCSNQSFERTLPRKFISSRQEQSARDDTG
jgi:hypothetical protein